MECHDRADSDTGRGRNECLQVNAARTSVHAEANGSQAQDSAGQHAAETAHLSQNQLREDGVTREDRVSNISNDPERALRSYAQQFQKANRSPGGAASSTRSSKDENSVKVSRQPRRAA